MKKTTENETYTRFILKYSNTKQGYIQTTSSDPEWYSISGKKYPIVVYAKEEAFNVNGVIELSNENVEKIYVWVPRFRSR